MYMWKHVVLGCQIKYSHPWNVTKNDHTLFLLYNFQHYFLFLKINTQHRLTQAFAWSLRKEETVTRLAPTQF